jgi:hypothetical protein
MSGLVLLNHKAVLPLVPNPPRWFIGFVKITLFLVCFQFSLNPSSYRCVEFSYCDRYYYSDDSIKANVHTSAYI